jgi:hypothetical protein
MAIASNLDLDTPVQTIDIIHGSDGVIQYYYVTQPLRNVDRDFLAFVDEFHPWMDLQAAAFLC